MESKRWFTARIVAGQGGSGRITAWACMTSGLPASQGKIAGLADFTQAAVQPAACGQGCKICAGGEIGRRTTFRSCRQQWCGGSSPPPRTIHARLCAAGTVHIHTDSYRGRAMAVTVETLDKLERKMTLSLPVTLIQSEVDMRLRRMARTVKMDGFRPGKVPMAVVARRYGDAVQYEVLTNKVGEAFTVAANEANLRVAGRPRITETQGTAEGHVTFDAIFEVFPEVRIADL